MYLPGRNIDVYYTFSKKKKELSIFLLKNVLIHRSFDYLRVSTGSVASDPSLDYAVRVSGVE